MAIQPRILILRAPGTTCDGETAHAFQRAGGQTEVVHVRRLMESPGLLGEAQILCIPGGFSYGDDIASGRILALQLKRRLAGALREFQLAGKLILGICNGFQVLLRGGLLAGDRENNPAATLTWNASGRFQAAWVQLAVAGGRSVFLSGIERMYLPVAHAQGRFVAKDGATLTELERGGQVVLRYSDDVPDSVAGLSDATGRILGLMPHPERYIDPTQHPRWTRGEAAAVGDGLRLFQNAVNYFR